jgi:TRAP-type uncharacterized transport system substrate-binding protein
MEKKTPEQMIAELRQSALWDIEGQRDKLKERYESIPSQLKKVAGLTGIDETTIITLAVRTTFSHANLTWDQVLSVVQTFYLHKRNLEQEQED